MRPPMMVDSLVRRQASTVPARVLASVASTLPVATSFNTTGMGLGRVNQAKARPRTATMATTTAMRRMTNLLAKTGARPEKQRMRPFSPIPAH